MTFYDRNQEELTTVNFSNPIAAGTLDGEWVSSLPILNSAPSLMRTP